jgi:hypothetical protein
MIGHATCDAASQVIIRRVVAPNRSIMLASRVRSYSRPHSLPFQPAFVMPELRETVPSLRCVCLIGFSRRGSVLTVAEAGISTSVLRAAAT